MAAAAELVLRFNMWLNKGWPKHENWCHHLLTLADFTQLIVHPSVDSSACLQALQLIRRWLRCCARDILEPNSFRAYANRRMDTICRMGVNH